MREESAAGCVGTVGNSDYDFNLDDVSVVVVPEPSSLLLGAAALPLLLRRRRK